MAKAQLILDLAAARCAVGSMLPSTHRRQRKANPHRPSLAGMPPIWRGANRRYASSSLGQRLNASCWSALLHRPAVSLSRMISHPGSRCHAQHGSEFSPITTAAMGATCLAHQPLHGRLTASAAVAIQPGASLLYAPGRPHRTACPHRECV